MDIFFLTLISGMATGLVLELLSSILGRLIPVKILRIILVLPTAYAAAYFLGIVTPAIWVVTPASGFFALFVLRLLDRPVTITTTRR